MESNSAQGAVNSGQTTSDQIDDLLDLAQAKASTDEVKKQMLQDPHALVVPDGTEVIGENQYRNKEYERVFIPKSVIEI